MKIAAATDTGLVRENNEDAYWLDKELQAMALADGMGGHNGGEIASLLATQSFGMFCNNLLARQRLTGSISACMSEIIPSIDRLVRMTGDKTVYLTGMGTTLVGAIYSDNMLHLTHVGDSRAAFISLVNGELTWLTKDDNYAEYLVSRGEMTPEQARRSNYRHRLTACIGGYEAHGRITDAHCQRTDWPADNILLLCSDGLLDGNKDEEIASAVIKGNRHNLAGACKNLINLANSKGGRDNCTVILADRIQGGER
jgi:protein phosphatase